MNKERHLPTEKAIRDGYAKWKTIPIHEKNQKQVTRFFWNFDKISRIFDRPSEIDQFCFFQNMSQAEDKFCEIFVMAGEHLKVIKDYHEFNDKRVQEIGMSREAVLAIDASMESDYIDATAIIACQTKEDVEEIFTIAQPVIDELTLLLDRHDRKFKLFFVEALDRLNTWLMKQVAASS